MPLSRLLSKKEEGVPFELIQQHRKCLLLSSGGVSGTLSKGGRSVGLFRRKPGSGLQTLCPFSVMWQDHTGLGSLEERGRVGSKQQQKGEEVGVAEVNEMKKGESW